MDQIPILPDERLDDLQRSGLSVLQKVNGFRFGTDAVLLADYVRLGKGGRVCDLGTGTGVLPLLLSARHPEAEFDAVELQTEMAEMSDRSVRLNHLEDRIRIHRADVREAAGVLGYERFDAVVTNPPYTAEGSGLVSPDPNRAASRNAASCSLEEWLISAGKILKNRGRFFCVFPAYRMLQLFDAMRGAGIEPKRLRLVASGIDKPPKLLLCEGLKGGAPGLLFEPMLVTHNGSGSFSEEMCRIYEGL